MMKETEDIVHKVHIRFKISIEQFLGKTEQTA